MLFRDDCKESARCEFIVRTARREDLGELAELVRQEVLLQHELANWFELKDDVDWKQNVSLRLRARDTEILVAELNGRLVGYVETRRAPRLATIEDVYVAPSIRRAGCGRALVGEGLRRLKKRGVSQVHAAIWAANEESQAFFARLGFHTLSVTLIRRLEEGGE